jgi:hypothetical protein
MQLTPGQALFDNAVYYAKSALRHRSALAAMKRGTSIFGWSPRLCRQTIRVAETAVREFALRSEIHAQREADQVAPEVAA